MTRRRSSRKIQYLFDVVRWWIRRCLILYSPGRVASAVGLSQWWSFIQGRNRAAQDVPAAEFVLTVPSVGSSTRNMRDGDSLSRDGRRKHWKLRGGGGLPIPKRTTPAKRLRTP